MVYHSGVTERHWKTGAYLRTGRVAVRMVSATPTGVIRSGTMKPVYQLPNGACVVLANSQHALLVDVLNAF